MFSVVIPAYNEEKNIAKTLESLVAQKTSKKFEVIVVDNASTDKTAKIAQSYKNKLNLKVISEPKKGRSPARRTGFENAKGDIILSTDSDTIVTPNWINDLTKHFSDPQIAAVSGTCIINDCTDKINKSFNKFQPRAMKAYNLAFGYYWLSGFNFAIRREIYNLAGGFDPEINIQEDVDLAKRVQKIGKIKFIDDLPVLFSGRRFKNGLIKGLTPYVTSYINYFYIRRKPYLSDIR